MTFHNVLSESASSLNSLSSSFFLSSPIPLHTWTCAATTADAWIVIHWSWWWLSMMRIVPFVSWYIYPQSSFRIAMADIKLSYFDARGRAELSRLILAYAGVPLSSSTKRFILAVQNSSVGHFVTRSLNHSSYMVGLKHDPRSKDDSGHHSQCEQCFQSTRGKYRCGTPTRDWRGNNLLRWRQNFPGASCPPSSTTAPCSPSLWLSPGRKFRKSSFRNPGYSSFIFSTPTRFLATEYGLTGRSSLEAAQADEIVDAITDIVNVRVGAVFEPDEAKKAEKMQAYMSQTLPTGMVIINLFMLNHKRLLN